MRTVGARRTRRLLLPVAVAGALALSGCGTERPGQPGGPSDPATATATASGSAGPQTAERAAHDRAFPGVARACAEAPSTAPSGPAPTGATMDPEAATYAENHAFTRELPMRPDAECRGRAHAERIVGALSGAAGKAAADEPGLREALAGLGYPAEGTEVYQDGGGRLAFSLSVPETGLCVSGRLGPPVAARAHGYYAEGGCVKPRGGH
ncbi:hypothetical protein [Streptomyces sp. NPDC046887]|uniref:hypothetical protein n=1 Tax=Streptomyces sp. NPDC046887 TaxID=3155472 RepID=UPI0033CC0291